MHALVLNMSISHIQAHSAQTVQTANTKTLTSTVTQIMTALAA